MKTIAQNQKIAIIGMDCFINNSPTLNQFERLIYETKQNLVISHDSCPSPTIIYSALENAKIK
ncbi:hypothetical protein IQ231_05920, partial [Cuspidothrix issatschenkoi LEGE 03284]|uniref:hypothetical protein n=1 Tax=Cuspidothrix issatschenkoi TaxID=230752 RepID=UPI0018803BE3